MFDRWQQACARKGLDAPTEKHGYDWKLFQPGSDEIGSYLAKQTFDHAEKAGLEAAAGMGKTANYGNRTPFAILRSIVDTGDADDLDLWHEWEKGSQGRRQVGWSRGFRAWLKLPEQRADEVIAADDMDGEVIAHGDAATFGRIRWDKAAVLEAAEQLPLSFLKSAPITMWVQEHEHRRRLGTLQGRSDL